MTELASGGTPEVRRVGLVAKRKLHQASTVLGDIIRWLEAHGIAAVVERETGALLAGASPRAVAAEELPKEVDLVVLLGGDGTLLATAGHVARSGADVPILGVNFGGLGFLTEITLDELYPALESAIAGRTPHDLRLMLQASIETLSGARRELVVLNDVVITKGTLARMIDLSVEVDGQHVARFKADGLIIATPTGSTAYNMSAGGPIVHPAVEAVVLTPIAPHTLTNRPVVIRAGSVVQVWQMLEASTAARDDIFVTFDGQASEQLPPDRLMTVTCSPRPLRLLRPTGRTYFDVLRQKLKWAER
jgi:NAD+ kinase